MNKISKHFLIVVAAIYLFFAAPCFAQCPISTTPEDVVAIVNVAAEAKLLFYGGAAAGFVKGRAYTALSCDRPVGYIQVIGINAGYVEAMVLNGDFRQFEGKHLIFRSQVFEMSRPHTYQGVNTRVIGQKKTTKPRTKKEPEEAKPKPKRKVKSKPRPRPSAVVKPPPPEKKKSPVVLNYMVMYEAHNNDYSDDDFVYALISGTRKYSNNVFGTLYYMRKENLDTNDHHANVFGLSVMRMLKNKTIFSAGYSLTDEDFGESRGDWDVRTLQLTASKLLKSDKNYYYRLGAYYNQRWGSGGYRHRSYGPKLQGNYVLGDRITGKLAYMGTYSGTYSEFLSHQWTAGIAKQYPKGKLALEYVHVNHVWSSLLDDDNIIRVIYTFKGN